MNKTIENNQRKRRKMRMARRRAILGKIRNITIAGVGLAAFIVLGNFVDLREVAPDYVVPEKAISGGIVNIKGRDYERFQYKGKFYLLDLSNGAWIPQ